MSDTSVTDVNLSEVLFKPKHNYIETSLISNSGCPLPPEAGHLFRRGSHFRSLWYRPLFLYSWTELGANNLDVEEALSKILMSENARSRPECFDTVEQYGSGNWIYEFCTIAQKRVNMGAEAEKAGDLLQASHQYRMASRYFAIAAYPNLKGDILSSQAAMMCRINYRKIFNDTERFGHYSEESFKVRGQFEVTGYLHSPDNKELHPCVIVSSAYESTSTDFYRLFDLYLRPLGIALFVVDMPGMGTAADMPLDEQCSDILEAAVQHLKDKVPYIDSTALGAVGSRISANAVIRLTVMKRDLFKSVAVISPFVHSFFTDQELLNSLPLSQRSSVANRMNLDASSWDTIVPQLQVLSLKKQGLISYSTKLSVPCLGMYLPKDLCFVDDSEIIENMFTNCTSEKFKKMRVADQAKVLQSKAAEFFKSTLL